MIYDSSTRHSHMFMKAGTPYATSLRNSDILLCSYRILIILYGPAGIAVCSVSGNRLTHAPVFSRACWFAKATWHVLGSDVIIRWWRFPVGTGVLFSCLSTLINDVVAYIEHESAIKENRALPPCEICPIALDILHLHHFPLPFKYMNTSARYFNTKPLGKYGYCAWIPI